MKITFRAGCAAIVACTLFLLMTDATAQVPVGYPSSYADIVAAAKKEGRVVIYAATDLKASIYLIKDFEALYPGIKVEYNEIRSTELYNRYTGELRISQPSADLLWGSAMDLMIKLVNDGYAQVYKSPETNKLPSWATWRDEAYGTTYEPIVFVYNKRLVTGNDIPQTHAGLEKLLTSQPERFKNKVITYDAEYGIGFTLATQDNKSMHGSWDLVKAMGAVNLQQVTSTAIMLEKIASGESLIGYNLLGSYVAVSAKTDPALGYVLPKDYTLVISRIAFISNAAKNANAARLFLDYLLSQRGQTVMATQSNLHAIRADVEGEFTASALTKLHGKSIKPINVGQGLLFYLDATKRAKFLDLWKQATTRQK